MSDDNVQASGRPAKALFSARLQEEAYALRERIFDAIEEDPEFPAEDIVCVINAVDGLIVAMNPSKFCFSDRPR